MQHGCGPIEQPRCHNTYVLFQVHGPANLEAECYRFQAQNIHFRGLTLIHSIFFQITPKEALIKELKFAISCQGTTKPIRKKKSSSENSLGSASSVQSAHDFNQENFELAKNWTETIGNNKSLHCMHVSCRV